MNITEVLVPAQQTAWLPWAVQYFFYIGSAYAAAILFLIAYILRDKTSHQLRSALVVVLAIGAIVGPLALTGDLHQPGRAWHFYFHITTWSWMSLGSIFLPLFSGLAVATAWLYLRADIAKLQCSESKIAKKVALLALGQWQTPTKLMTAVAGLAVVSGLTIATYTGAEVSVIQSRPLWNQAASPFIWFVTAFIGAIGLTMLLLALFPRADKATILTQVDSRILKRALALTSLLALILLPIWSSNNANFSLYENSAWLVRLLILAISFVVCIFVAGAVFNPAIKRTAKPNRLSRKSLFIAAAISIFTCWYLRWVTMIDVQSIPKYDLGPFNYQLPLGSSGLLSIVGMAGLWLAIALAASEIMSSNKPSRQSSAQANT